MSTPASHAEETRLRDLRAGSAPVAIVARIVTAEHREVVRKSDGGRRPVLSGLLSDGTATVRFTWWDPPKEPIERGSVLRAAPVEVREFRGAVELTLGWRTKAAPASPSELPELTAEERRPRALSELKTRQEGFVVLARIAQVSEKAVTVGADRRVVFEGILEDANDDVAFTAWSDFRLRAGETVRISGGYVGSFRGLRRLTLDERAQVERVDAKLVPPSTRSVAPVPLGRLVDGSGSERTRIIGRVVGLQPPSGILARCPSCHRRTDAGACRVHGMVTTEPDLSARAVIDDGTGTLSANLDRGMVERLTGRTLADYRQLLAERADPSAVEAALAESLFGRRLELEGPVRRDEYGLSMDPREVHEQELDLVAAAKELRHRASGGGGS
jgi:replication factor A1